MSEGLRKECRASIVSHPEGVSARSGQYDDDIKCKNSC